MSIPAVVPGPGPDTAAETTAWPATAFADPSGRNARAVEALFEDAARRVARRLARAGERALVPSGAALPAECWTAGALVPDHPVPDADLLARLELLLDGAMNPAHPGYVGHMDPPATTMSLVGDLAAAAVNNNLLSVEMSPAFSRLEWRLCAALAECFGLGDGAGGVMTAGGSLANLLALAVARNQAFAGAAIMAEGLAGLPRQPVLFASELAHTSVRKSAMLLGLGTDAVVPVGVDERGCLDAAALERAVAGAERHGQAPFAVVATAGTTVTGSIDPLDAIADVAARNGLWLHVDAAYGGGLVFSDAERGRLDGIGRADSLTFNPQKWAYVAKTCAMALFRDVAVLERHLRIAAPYMRELEDDPDAIPNLGELGVQGTRHADVLKLWLTLQQLGRDGLAALVAHGYALARAVVERVHARAYLTLAPECAPEPAMNVVCFRGTPAWLPPARWDAWNAELQAALVAGGHAFLSLPRHRGARWLRVVLLNPATTVATLDALFAAVDAFAVTTRAAAQTP